MPLGDAGRHLGGPSRVGVALEYPQMILGRLRGISGLSEGVAGWWGMC